MVTGRNYNEISLTWLWEEQHQYNVKTSLCLSSLVLSAQMEINPGNNKENPKTVDDDDDENEKEKQDDDNDDDVNDDHTDHTLDETQETGSLETRNEKMQTPIHSPHRSPRIDLSSDKNLSHDLVYVSPTHAATSQDPSKSKRFPASLVETDPEGALTGFAEVVQMEPEKAEVVLLLKAYRLKEDLGDEFYRWGPDLKLGDENKKRCINPDSKMAAAAKQCTPTDFYKCFTVKDRIDEFLDTAQRSEIRKYQKSTKLLIRKLPFQRLVREDDDGFWFVDGISALDGSGSMMVFALISKEFADHAPKLIEEIFQTYIQNNVITVHPTTRSSTATPSSADLQQQLYSKMKKSLQDQADDPELWEHQEDDAPPEGEKRAKRQKTSKSSKPARGSSSKQPVQISETYVSKRQQQQQEWDSWVEEPVSDVDEVIPEDDSPKLIEEFQNVDKHVPTVYDHERMEAMLRDMMSNQLRKVEEYAYHLEQSTDYMENQIVKKEFKTFNEKARLSIQHWKDSWHKRLYKINHRRVRANPEEYFSNHVIVDVVRVTTEQQHGLDFLEQIIMMRENDKPNSFSEANFKYLNKNDIEDLYYLFQNKKVDYRENKLLNSLITFIRSRVIWERVHDFQLNCNKIDIP
ncbi:putative gag-pol polyprotein [Tanacetum coccineum]